MGDGHLSRELLDAVFGGERTPGDLVPVVLGHLFHLCPRCRETFEEWQRQIPASAALSYGEIAAAATGKARRALPRIRKQEEAARAFLEELLELPPAQRAQRLDRAPKEAKGPALAHGLIEACREALPARPQDSLALARLARTVLQHAELSLFVAELYARAVAYVGNALRILGRLPEAAEVMAHARFILRQEGGGDRLTRAELDNLEGLVRLHQRDYTEAERLLKRAILGFQLAGATQEVLRSKMNLAIVFDYGGDVASCIRMQRELVGELESAGEESRLSRFARHNLAVSLVAAEQFQEAMEILEENRAALGPEDSYAQLRMVWLDGMLARGLGDLEAAESHFSAARHGFAKLELPFDTAFVSLDLANVYLQQGRTGEVQRLAAELLRAFEGQQRLTEALAALLLFRSAAELERVSFDLIHELAAFLRRASLDPDHKFTPRVDRRC